MKRVQFFTGLRNLIMIKAYCAVRHARARELCSCKRGKKGQEQPLGGNEPWPDYTWPARWLTTHGTHAVTDWLQSWSGWMLELGAFWTTWIYCTLAQQLYWVSVPWYWQQRAVRVAFVRRNQDLSLHWAEAVPNGSKTEVPQDTQLSLLAMLVAPLQKYI